MTHQPVSEQDLLDRLRAVDARGTYEAHVTVSAPDEPARARFRTTCAGLGVKSVLIELPTGSTRSQPMTSSYHKGDLQSVTREVAGIARALRQAGFELTRIKLEAVVGTCTVPETDEEARALPPGNYFEFHVKV